MRKKALLQVIVMFLINFLIAATVDFFLYKADVWQYESTWLAIVKRSVFLALLLTFLFKWNDIKLLLKNKTRERDQL